MLVEDKQLLRMEEAVAVLVQLKDHRQQVHKMLDYEKFKKNSKMKEKKNVEWLKKSKA